MSDPHTMVEMRASVEYEEDGYNFGADGNLTAVVSHAGLFGGHLDPPSFTPQIQVPAIVPSRPPTLIDSMEQLNLLQPSTRRSVLDTDSNATHFYRSEDWASFPQQEMERTLKADPELMQTSEAQVEDQEDYAGSEPPSNYKKRKVVTANPRLIPKKLRVKSEMQPDEKDSPSEYDEDITNPIKVPKHLEQNYYKIDWTVGNEWISRYETLEHEWNELTTNADRATTLLDWRKLYYDGLTILSQPITCPKTLWFMKTTGMTNTKTYLEISEAIDADPNFKPFLTWVSQPLPHPIHKGKVVGPWVFQVNLPDGWIVDESTAGVVRGGQTKYQSSWPEIPKAELPKSKTVKLLSDKRTFQVDQIIVRDSTNACTFTIEFQIHCKGPSKNGKIISVAPVLASAPIVSLSNWNQWSAPEGAYAAWDIFGGNEGPNDTASWGYMFNSLQFFHLTCTRQMVHPSKLSKMEKAMPQHPDDKRRSLPDSGRTKDALHKIHLYQSFVNYTRVKRMLKSEEIETIFRPQEDGTISYKDFCAAWDWYGTFMYKLYTGQMDGSINRHLWLSGFLFFQGPHASLNHVILNPAVHPVGTFLLRTSSEAGLYSISYIGEVDGVPVLSHSRTPGTNLALELNEKSSLRYIIHSSGTLFDKSEILGPYVKVVNTVLPEGYNHVT